MVALDLLTPTKIRTLTYYDRCAILLDPDEMTSQRLRISVVIVGTPISRSINFKYPYNREFFGYAQSFWLNNLLHEFPINYTSQYIWDYWNEHATLAHQFTSALQKLSKFLSGSIDYMQFVLIQGSAIAAKLEMSRPEVEALPKDGFIEEGFGLPFDNNPANDIINTFVHPFDLIRFKFPFGTVFRVSIASWNLGATYSGSQSQAYPETPPYPTANPSGYTPTPTPGSRDPNNPYGQSPPASDPIDPRLDPSDFSNAPDPSPPAGTAQVQGWQIPGIPSVQGRAVAIGCPGATIDASLGVTTGLQNAVSLGVVTVPIDSQGRVSVVALVAAFPEWIPVDNIFSADARCGISGFA